MPNNPTLDRSVQWRIDSGSIDPQEPRYRSVVEGILSSGLATEVVRPVSAGKEAEVYLATYNGSPLAIKVYRLYRTSHRGGRPIKVDSMAWRAAHEFDVMYRAWRGGATVPTPAQRVENMFSMRYLGDEDGPAPRLQDVRLEDPGAMLEEVLGGVEALARAGIVHGDLSAFNILIHDGRPWFIDFSEGFRVDRLGAAPLRRLAEARAALTHGLMTLQAYFRRYGMALDVDPLVLRLVEGMDRFGVLP